MSGGALFWWRWLVVVAAGVVVFGLSLVLTPGLGRTLFSLLIYASPDAIDGLGEAAVPYISMVHGVLGAVMVGWGVALLFVLLGPFRRGSREAWFTVSVSLVVWFITDTAFSLWTGFWQNAVLNTVLIVLFAIPLVAIRPVLGKSGS